MDDPSIAGLRNARDRARRQRESHEARESRLQSLRLAIQQEAPEQREQRLRARRERYQARRQQESSEQRQHRLERERQRRQRETTEQWQRRLDRARTRNRSVQQFHSDLLTALDYCRVCHCLMFSDKAKEVSNSSLTSIHPTALPPDLTVATVIVCSKCHTQLTKSTWPSTSYTNNLKPDEIPMELAILTPDEVRIITLVCPFLKVIILPGGQFGEEGSVIHFPFPVQQVMTQLPRPLHESELILTAVGVADRHHFQTLLQQLDHRRIHSALLWLQMNNPLYASIQTTQTNQLQSDNISNTNHSTFVESSVVPQNYVDPDIPIEQLLQRQNTTPRIPFPRIVAPPINMFQHDQLEEHAFPVLYPKGRFGLGYTRDKPITDLKYMQCRLFNKDSRWRDNVIWMFWSLNMFEMKKLHNEISIVSRIKKSNNQPLTAADLTDPSSESLSNSYMFMKNIRGTAAYWKDQLLDLLAKMNTLCPPTFFVTLTANDLHWPELFQLIDPTLTSEAVA